MTGPGGAHLGLDDSQPFVVCRRLGKAEEPVPPVHRDFALMFMAAEPEGTSELDYEVEESGILTATERLPVRLQVEESGALAFLGERLAADGPFEALHLSCHGQIGEQGPYLALETETGALHPATAGDLVGAVGQNKPVLTFLSACRTAETDGTGERAVTPLARQITMSGIPNVIGWDGSVYDTDAIVFARTLYEQLAKKAEIPLAVAMARVAVHRAATEAGRPENCHWHLARLYLGPTGGGRLCEAGKPGRQFRKDVGHKEFLDPKRETVPVATAREFVGRRREAQRIIRALRGNAQDGVLITGMGNLGKSSLAARVANRLSNLTPVVIFGKERSAYAARNILAAVLDAVPAVERAGCRERWEQAVANDPVALREALEDLLGGALAEKPILLIIDDLEKILVEPEAQDGAVRVPLRDAAGVPELYRVTLGAVLRAFHGDNSDSRLLLTSRYDFTVPEGGQELSEPLYREPLIPMRERQRIKQWKAKREVQGEGGVEVDPALVMDLLGVSGGNPGLQDVLSVPVFNGEVEAARRAIADIRRYRQTGEHPAEDSAAQDFFARMAFETYGAALTGDQQTALRAATLFSEGMPVPMAALEAAARALGAGQQEGALARLLALGLLDDHRMGGDTPSPHAAANPLARSPEIAGDPLDAAERATLATAIMPPLHAAWKDAEDNFPHDPRGVEAARLALTGETDPAMLDAAATAAGNYLYNRVYAIEAGDALMLPAVARLERMGWSLSPGLALTAGRRQVHQGDIVSAQKKFERAADGFASAGKKREAAIAFGHIADILQARGDIDEAYRIKIEEEMPVYEALGDKQSRAVTLVEIGDILMQHRGKPEEALPLYREARDAFAQMGARQELDITEQRIAMAQGEGPDMAALAALMAKLPDPKQDPEGAARVLQEIMEGGGPEAEMLMSMMRAAQEQAGE